MIKSFEQVRELAAKLQDKKIAVCMAENEDVLIAVETARKAGIAQAILVGDEEKIKTLLKKNSIEYSSYEIINVLNKEEAAFQSVQLVREKKADILMKGLIDTSIILKAVLNKETGLRDAKVLSHVAAFQVSSYHKLLFITDAAMNINPDVDQKEAIIRNAIQVTKALDIVPAKVACLAAKEKVSEKMQATIDADALKKRTIEGAIIDGPLALDNAINAESARLKGIESEVTGDADILLVPQIESGNILYKSLSYFTDSDSAGILIGAKCPVVLTSRTDNDSSKLNSIALAMLVAANKEA